MMTYLEEKAFVKEKAKKLGIDLPDRWYLPMGKNCLVARLPPKNRTEGGLWLADTDTESSLYGILIAAGLAARDIMYGALIAIGDVVKFGKFEGAEEEFERERLKQGKYILQVKIEGINGSVEADKRAEEDYDIEIVDTDDGVEHTWVPREKKTSKGKAA
jgi:co-chaperonin GroES (HSP10)